MKEKEQVKEYVNKIGEFIGKQQYKKIVLQLPKEMLSLSFDLTSVLRRQFAGRQFYALYDSLKQPCCTDTLGAQHVNYDCLIHFGRACFSSPHKSNQFYIFEEPVFQTKASIKQLIMNPELPSVIADNNIGYLLIDQPYYQFVKQQLDLSQLNIELLSLPYDAQEGDQYLFFGYYTKTANKSIQNLLIIADQNQDQFSQQMSFIEKIGFGLKSMQSKLGQTLFVLGEPPGSIKQLKINNTKRLMQRYSIASQLDNFNVFGVLVSNTAASYVDKTVARCQQLLKRHKKKCFLFMMNNLNEVKLGNFPQIEVYVIVSCFNHSLFLVKDFHKHVVTPTDLQIAFEKRRFDEYGFDLNAEALLEHAVNPVTENQEESTSTQMEVSQGQQVALQNKIQTLAFYQQRQFKGLTFSDKKQVKKLTKGKIGLAQQYVNLE